MPTSTPLFSICQVRDDSEIPLLFFQSSYIRCIVVVVVVDYLLCSFHEITTDQAIRIRNWKQLKTS